MTCRGGRKRLWTFERGRGGGRGWPTNWPTFSFRSWLGGRFSSTLIDQFCRLFSTSFIDFLWTIFFVSTDCFLRHFESFFNSELFGLSGQKQVFRSFTWSAEGRMVSSRRPDSKRRQEKDRDDDNYDPTTTTRISAKTTTRGTTLTTKTAAATTTTTTRGIDKLQL